MQSKGSYKYVDLHFSVKPTTIPVYLTSKTEVVARIAGNREVMICENLEEIQILWDLEKEGNISPIQWGIIETS